MAARNHLMRALPLVKKALGPDHPDVALLMNNLGGGIFLRQGDPAWARRYLEPALAICRRKLGENHPRTQQVRANLRALSNRRR